MKYIHAARLKLEVFGCKLSVRNPSNPKASPYITETLNLIWLAALVLGLKPATQNLTTTSPIQGKATSPEKSSMASFCYESAASELKATGVTTLT